MFITRAIHTPPLQQSAQLSQLLSRYASIAPRQINLSQLLSFGRPLTQDSVLASVSYTLAELPRRLATRVRSLEALPFIVGTNPYITKTLNAYKDSFVWLATHAPVTSLRENEEFVEMLAAIVHNHTNDIPTMAKGCAPLTLPDSLFAVRTLNSFTAFRNPLGTCLRLR